MLQQTSLYFERMFGCGMRESRGNCISLPGTDRATFELGTGGGGWAAGQGLRVAVDECVMGVFARSVCAEEADAEHGLNANPT